jgi:hypothetical protein
MPVTYNKIASVTVGSGGAASIDFTSIPATFTDLVIKLSARPTTGGVTQFKIQFNSLGGTAYSDRTLEGAGSGTPSSFSRSSQAFILALGADPFTTSTFSNADTYIPNYAGSTSKSVSIDSVTEANQTTSYVNLVSGLSTNTNAINAINLTLNATNFAQYSTATLYGIKKD